MRILQLAVLFLTFVPAALGQDQAAADKLFAAAEQSPTLENNLRVLTDEIGGRVPGTPAMEQAVKWAANAFRAAGADRVATEEFEMPASWAEGETRFEVSAPVKFKVDATSIAWGPSLKQTTARVVSVGDGSEEGFAKAGNIKGAVVLVRTKLLKGWEDLFGEYMLQPGILDRAKQGGAVMVAFLSSREGEILYRHLGPPDPGREGHIGSYPQMIISREDGMRIERLLEAGKTVTAQVSMTNKIGPAFKTHNVVGEIRGSERPDEWVMLGAHLDSWEMGTGALDNGANCALVVDALRAIKQSGLKPRLSIRFVLFSGEEQGIIGSWKYARAHRDELDKSNGVVIFDTGIGKVTGFSLGGRKDVEAAAQKLLAPLAKFEANTLTTGAFWGTDNFDFMVEGVPTYVADQEPHNYMVNYHAFSDTLDKIDMPTLRRHVAIAAYTTFALADSPERIGKRLNRAEVETMMRETGVEQQMKTLHLWPSWENGKRGRAAE